MYVTNDRSSAIYTATLTDATGAAVAASTLTTLTLTLYDEVSGTIVNSRDGQNVLNVNNVTVSESGVLTWLVQPADTACVGVTATEVHVALFRATWSAGTRAHNWEVKYAITNLARVA